MIKSIFKRNFSGILFPIAFICIIFDDKLGITAITPWTVLIAAALGSLGLSMIFHNKPNKYFNNHHDWISKKSSITCEEGENSIKLNTSFIGRHKLSASLLLPYFNIVSAQFFIAGYALLNK